MKIGYITNLYPPYILGGAEIIVEKTVKQMSKLGQEVIVITTSPDNDEHIVYKDITIYQITTKLYQVYNQSTVNPLLKPLWHCYDLWNKDTLDKIKKILKKENVDIVNIHNFKGLSLSCFKAPKDLNIPVVFTSHDFSLICPRANLITGKNKLCKSRNFICNQYVKKQKKLLNKNIDLLISPSDFMINKFKENNFFNDIKTVKIPLGVDFKVEKSEKIYDTFDLLYVGTMGKHKGVDTLINAVKQIHNPEIRLHLVGKGYDLEEFQMLAKEDDRIIFHGFVENEEVIKMYQNANITVVPSICYDNSPVVIYESFSTGTPVIGSNIGGIPELIIPGINGLLFEAGNVNDLKEIIIKLSNRVILEELEENTIKNVTKDSIKLMTKNILKEYEKILNKQ